MMWLTPFLHLRCKAIFFTSLMTVLSWYNYDIKLTSCYRKVYEKNGYIMDKKEFPNCQVKCNKDVPLIK